MNQIVDLVRYIKIFKDYLGLRMFFVYFFGAVASLFEGIGIIMFLPLIQSFDNSSSNQESNSFLILVNDFINWLGIENSMFSILVLITSIFIIKGCLVFIALSYNSYLTGQLLKTIKQRLFNLYTSMTYSYYTKKNTGHLINLINEQPSKTLIAFRKLTTFMSNLINTTILIILAFSVSAILGSISLGIGLIIVFLFLRINKYVRTLSIVTAKEDGNLNKWLIQTLQGFKYLVSTNQIFRLQKNIIKSIKILSSNQIKTGVAAAFTQSVREPIAVILIVTLIYIQIFILGLRLEPLLISIALFYRALNSILALQNGFQGTFEYIGSLELINKEFLSQSKNQFLKSGKEEINFKEKLTLKDVSFKYDENKGNILKSISLSIPFNSSIGIVGASGSGKTSLVDILTMINIPSSGTMKIDGLNANKINIDQWRNQVGYVSQDPIIFDDTIRNNISMWKSNTDKMNYDSRIIKACKKANILNFINSLPNGFDTLVGDRGLMLSGGQKQRLAIAREIFRQPKLLILDEATSSLDSDSETEIQKSINLLMGKITIVIIAHRLSTIKKVDKIFLLEDGEIIESGTYEELKNNNISKFSNLARLQVI
ncbi:MAG: ABC transporter ATP-binding protein [Flammeovirgaceae bacterium]